ncbi:Do family serine endopeptidase [Opitutus sp. ER46]|uniref:Do family serine endopeptidase n=1 Tax=Opitutus sp. ER46 TaxID=2161864 RepID=UPI000D30AFB6|nr:Do family serine endopeptidase [Opitutus sp. ER46]PTX96489.1 protease Do [Opitutus sp. ER46]
MNLPTRILLATVVAWSSTGAANPKTVAKPAQARPTINLRVDDSALGENKPGAPLLSYADVLEPVQKAVVSIYSTKIVRNANPLLQQLFPNLPPRESKQDGLGSGVIVTPDGYILTNNHVVEGADELKVSLADDREFTAKVIGTDPKTDVAVIKIEAEKLPVVTLADSDKLRVGDVVFAVGNPLDVGQTVTMGIVSAKNRNVKILEDVGGYEDFIQTDAAINLGNSGGALIDARGRLVGVNSAILSPSRGNIGIGFAIPVNLAASIMKSLVETGTVARGYLGVSTETITPDVAEQLGVARDTRGVVITDIVPESAAEKAGLKRNDVILGVNGHAVGTLEEMRLMIAQMAPGSVAQLRVVRDGKESKMDVTLDKFADKPDELLSGVTVQPLGAEERRRLRIDVRVTGLLVTEVEEKSPFRESLAPGAVIMEINRTPVREVEEARNMLHPGRNLLAVYYRGAARFVVVVIE